MARARHLSLFSEEIHTSHGSIRLDVNGFVENAGELDLTEEQIVSLVPNFLDDEQFPLKEFRETPPVVEVAIFPAPASASPVVDEPAEAPEEDDPVVLDLIGDLLTDSSNLNSQGTLDMRKLNTALTALGKDKVSGAERDVLVEKVNSR